MWDHTHIYIYIYIHELSHKYTHTFVTKTLSWFHAICKFQAPCPFTDLDKVMKQGHLSTISSKIHQNTIHQVIICINFLTQQISWSRVSMFQQHDRLVSTYNPQLLTWTGSKCSLLAILLLCVGDIFGSSKIGLMTNDLVLLCAHFLIQWSFFSYINITKNTFSWILLYTWEMSMLPLAPNHWMTVFLFYI